MVLLVIDVQKGITDSRLYNYESFIERVVKIVDTARSNGVEIIYFQHDDGPGTGFSVYKNAVFDTNRKSLLRHVSAEKGLK